MLVTSIFFFSHNIGNVFHIGKYVFLDILYFPQYLYFPLTLKAHFTILVAFLASVDQDKAAQNMQPDLWFLSALVKHWGENQPWNLQLFVSYLYANKRQIYSAIRVHDNCLSGWAILNYRTGSE